MRHLHLLTIGLVCCAACVEPVTTVPASDTGPTSTDMTADAGMPSDLADPIDVGANGDVDLDDDARRDASIPDATTLDSGPDADLSTTPASCGVDLPFEPNFQFQQTVWVDPFAEGDGDGTEVLPFQTLQQAATAATPGTRIVLQPGTHSGNTFIQGFDDGTEQLPYGIVGEDGAILTNPAGGVIQLKSPKWVLLENLNIQDVVGGHGLNIDDSGQQDSAHHVVLRNVRIERVGPEAIDRCVRLTGVNDFIVEDSFFAQCQGHAIQVTGGLRGTIRNSRFENTANRGLSIEAGSADILIHGNSFESVGGRDLHIGGGGDLRRSDATYAAERVRVVANLSVLNGEVPIVDADCHECLYANNTIWRPPGPIIRIVRENLASLPGANGRFMNNIVTMAQLPSPIIETGTGPDIATYRFSNNLWHVENDPAFTGPVVGDFQTRDADVFGNPQYDGTNGRIHATSPAAGQGRRNVADGLHDGFGNCFADPPTIGMHEVAPTQ